MRVAVGAMVVVLHVVCRCWGQHKSQAWEGVQSAPLSGPVEMVDRVQ